MEEKSATHQIVVLGSANVDFVTYAPRLPKPGETLIGSKFVTSYGGKGANQCVAAAKLGGNTSMICTLGDDHWGKQYKCHLQELGVNVSQVTLEPNVTTGMAQITVAENGENQIVMVPGANNYLNKADVEKSAELIKKADIIVAQLETPIEITLEAFKLCNGIKLLNAAPARLDISEILAHCTVLCVNESEASLLTNFEVDFINAETALKALLKSGCEIVIITLGEKGVVYMTRQDSQPIHVLCEKVKPVDTTGAGDAFVGALALYLTTRKNSPIHQIIGAACHVATASVTKEGVQTSYPFDCDIKVFDKEYQYVKL